MSSAVKSLCRQYRSSCDDGRDSQPGAPDWQPQRAHSQGRLLAAVQCRHPVHAGAGDGDLCIDHARGPRAGSAALLCHSPGNLHADRGAWRPCTVSPAPGTAGAHGHDTAAAVPVIAAAGTGARHRCRSQRRFPLDQCRAVSPAGFRACQAAVHHLPGELPGTSWRGSAYPDTRFHQADRPVRDRRTVAAAGTGFRRHRRACRDGDGHDLHGGCEPGAVWRCAGHWRPAARQPGGILTLPHAAADNIS